MNVSVPEGPVNSVAETVSPALSYFFFFNDTATTEIYTLSLHDALPIPSLIEELAIENTGAASSLRMVPVAVPAVGEIVAPPVGVESETVKVSSASNSASAVVCTVKVLVVSPWLDRKRTRLHSSHLGESYAALCFEDA